VWHVHHHSLEDGSPLNPDCSPEGFAPIALCAPIDGERRLSKHVNSCFIGTTLEAELRERGITTLVVCGLTTNHCVSTTTRMAGNLGFGTYLVGDACATFDRVGVDGRKWLAEDVHQCSLSDLHREFAWVVTTEEVIRVV
jgi:nicotinamidase-related amidase